MKERNILVSLSLIFTDDEMNRVHISKVNDGETQMVADVHGMKTSESKKFIIKIIKIIRDAFRLIIIHGYNGGDSIRKMLRTDTLSYRVVRILDVDDNPGRTCLLINSLA